METEQLTEMRQKNLPNHEWETVFSKPNHSPRRVQIRKTQYLPDMIFEIWRHGSGSVMGSQSFRLRFAYLHFRTVCLYQDVYSCHRGWYTHLCHYVFDNKGL